MWGRIEKDTEEVTPAFVTQAVDKFWASSLRNTAREHGWNHTGMLFWSLVHWRGPRIPIWSIDWNQLNHSQNVGKRDTNEPAAHSILKLRDYTRDEKSSRRQVSRMYPKLTNPSTSSTRELRKIFRVSEPEYACWLPIVSGKVSHGITSTHPDYEESRKKG